MAALTVCHRVLFQSNLILYVPVGGRKQGRESAGEARSSASPRVPRSPVLWAWSVGRSTPLLMLTLLELAPPSSRRPDPADSHVLDEGVHPAGGPGDATLLLWDPDRCLALPGLR